MRFAAIDIGSNAARMLVSEVRLYKDGSPDFTKVSLVRFPLRLGFDVFQEGVISKEKKKKVEEAMKAYKYIMKVYDIEHYAAVATSAMRDAKNGKEIVAQIKDKIGIDIKIIDGAYEAELLFETQLTESFDRKKTYMYVDVGGGSTEVIFFKNNEIAAKRSFNVGTIRLLKEQVSDDEWDEMKSFVKKKSSKGQMQMVGSGGNINKVFSISKQQKDSPLHISIMKDYYSRLKKMNVADRIHFYKLREDRADVIVPALKIYTSIMRWGGFKDVLVPQVGLVDGIIKKLYIENSFTSMKLRQ